MEPILTDRLRLRPLTGDDLQPLHRMYADPVLMRFITGRPRTVRETRERLEKDLAHHREFGFGLCLVEWLDTGEVVGRAGLEPRPAGEVVEGELAWMIVQPWWGHGLATEAGAALIAFGRELGLARIFATANRANGPSLRIMQKLGMRRVAERGEEIEYEA